MIDIQHPHFPGIYRIYICLGKFDHDLNQRPNPGIIVFYGETIPKWPDFRLVKYCNLPRYVYIYIIYNIYIM